MSPNTMPAFAPQRSRLWRDQRCGKVTASKLGDLVARTKTGPSASRGSYMIQLLAERLSGEPVVIPASGPMRWGVEHEAEALHSYSFHYDLDVEPCGFYDHPAIEGSGASPDGLIGDDGLVEIKCPTSTTHIETIAAGEAPAKHLPQIQWQLGVTGRAWCDFVSYDPRMPPPLRLFVRRVFRDEAAIAALETEVVQFLQELEARERALWPGRLPPDLGEAPPTSGGAEAAAVVPALNGSAPQEQAAA